MKKIFKTFFTLIMALAMITSLFPMSIYASDDIALISEWDMASHTVSSRSWNFADTTENKNTLSAFYANDSGVGVNEKAGVSMYSQQKYIKQVGTDKSVYLVSGDNTEKLLNALDTKFTFETWVKFDEATNGALFTVSGGANNNYPLTFSTAPSETDKVQLVFRRMFETGENYWIISNKVNVGEWTHIVLSYDASSTLNEPLVIINGQKSSLTKSIDTASGVAKTHTEGTHSLELGRRYNNGWVIGKNICFAKTAFSSGITTEANAIETYNAEKPEYETEFSVYMYDMFDALISADALNEVKENGNTIKIDFTGANKETVNKNNVYIADVTADSWLSYNGVWENDTYVISDFSLTNGHSYDLVIKDIEDENGKIRETPQTTEFICDNKSELSVVAKYTVPNQSSKPASITNSADDTKYPLTIASADKIESLNATTYCEDKALYASNSAYWVTNANGGAELAKAFDGAFTYETWVKPSSSKTINGLFSVGEKTGDIDHTNVYLDGNKIVLRKSFSTTQGWWTTTNEVVKRDEWNHIIFSYDASVSKYPDIYVNGVKYTGGYSQTGAFNGAGNATTTADKERAWKVSLCGTVLSETANKLNGSWSTSTIYTGKISAYEAYEKYISEAEKYEPAYDVKVLSNDGTLYNKAELSKVAADLKITVDFSSANTSLVNENTVQIIDIKTNTAVSYTGSVGENSLYTISNMNLIEDGNYKLVISEALKDVSGNAIRTVPQTLSFTVNESEIESLVKYEMPDSNVFSEFIELKNSSGDFIGYKGTLKESNLNEDYPLNVLNIDLYGKVNENLIYSPYAMSADNLAINFDATAMKETLDGRLTYETYFKLNALNTNSGVFSIGNLGHQQAAYIDSTGLLKVRRDHSTGYKEWKANGITIATGKYYHIVIALDPSEIPVFYVNGIKYSAAISLNNSTGTPKKIADKETVQFNIMARCSTVNYAARSNATWVMSELYTGVATDKDVKALYKNAREKYDGYKVALLDSGNNDASELTDVTAVKARITVTTENKKPTVILAIYNGGKLKSVATGELKTALSTETSYIWETDALSISSGDEIKIMSWNELGDMTPVLCENYTYIK